jgi:hypothetical protein
VISFPMEIFGRQVASIVATYNGQAAQYAVQSSNDEWVDIRYDSEAKTYGLCVSWADGTSIYAYGTQAEHAVSKMRRELVAIGHRVFGGERER